MLTRCHHAAEEERMLGVHQPRPRCLREDEMLQKPETLTCHEELHHPVPLCVARRSCYADECDSDKYRASMWRGPGSDAVCLEKHDQALSVMFHQHPNNQGCRHRNAQDVSQGRPNSGGEPVLLNRFPIRPLHKHMNTCKNPKTILIRGVRHAFLIFSEHNPERQTRKAVHKMTRACMSKQQN
jgi:hypothetical protein